MSAETNASAHLDFSHSMSYGDYLQLDQVLAAQHPKSADHNEMDEADAARAARGHFRPSRRHAG
jgi:hypothetical protein